MSVLPFQLGSLPTRRSSGKWALARENIPFYRTHSKIRSARYPISFEHGVNVPVRLRVDNRPRYSGAGENGAASARTSRDPLRRLTLEWTPGSADRIARFPNLQKTCNH